VAAQRVLVVGSGLAAATAAYTLHAEGVDVEVVERQPWWGGQLRTAHAAGVSYEPHGAHIFHTRDEQVWGFVTSLVRMRPYRHRVLTEVGEHLLSWPPQVDELRLLREWPRIADELDRRPDSPRRANFEVWCVDTMGPTLYEWFVRPYTVKQWGVEPTQLSSHWAPKRLELRSDGYLDLFRDPYQGWPQGGYTGLVDALLRDVPVTLGVDINSANWQESFRGYDAAILTCALDDFFAGSLGLLDWRGVRLVHRWVPAAEHVLPAAVVNHPGMDQAYTRRIETKWMSGDTGPGTMVSEEYPGSEARHYPVDDVAGRNRELANQYAELAGRELGPRTVLAGRLATYSYIDMDQAVRQGLNAAHGLLRGERSVA
jgi:UDP-galactopyranose mutase